MPPDPILALLCLVGLFAYGVIGGAVGVVAMRALDPTLKHGGYGASVRGLADAGGNGDAWIGWAFMALLWPAVLAALLVATVAAGPVWCCVRVAKYLARAQIKELQ